MTADGPDGTTLTRLTTGPTSARLDDLHRSFARHLRAEGCADRTITIYGQATTFFSRWLEAQDREATVAEPNRAAIREWLAQLADVNEPSTVKTRYRGLSGSAAGSSTRTS